MVEILVLIALCNSNANRVKAKGRKPGLFIFLTILLWVGMEFLGALIGALLSLDNLGYSILPYGMALVFAVIGGILSYVISKNAKPMSAFEGEQEMGISIEEKSPNADVEWQSPDISSPPSINLHKEIPMEEQADFENN